MDYSTKNEIESRTGHSIEVSERGGGETCTVEVPWNAVRLWGEGGPSGKHLAKIDQVLAEYGFIKVSERKHSGPFNLLAGSKTILIYRKIG